MIMVVIQIIVAYTVRNASWPIIFTVAYVIGGTLNHSLSLGLHEIAHNLAFGTKYPLANRVLGLVANVPLGVPASVTFKKYHLDHHKYQGESHVCTPVTSF
jgi:sphingolipid delta-4 desaturase